MYKLLCLLFVKSGCSCSSHLDCLKTTHTEPWVCLSEIKVQSLREQQTRPGSTVVANAYNSEYGQNNTIDGGFLRTSCNVTYSIFNLHNIPMRVCHHPHSTAENTAVKIQEGTHPR